MTGEPLPARREPDDVQTRRTYRVRMDDVLAALDIHDPGSTYRRWSIDGGTLIIVTDTEEPR